MLEYRIRATSKKLTAPLNYVWWANDGQPTCWVADGYKGWKFPIDVAAHILEQILNNGYGIQYLDEQGIYGLTLDPVLPMDYPPYRPKRFDLCAKDGDPCSNERCGYCERK